MCPSNAPWIGDDDNILYGFVANQDNGQKNDCGTCYQFDILNSANPKVKKAKVQVTNKGGMGNVDPYGNTLIS